MLRLRALARRVWSSFDQSRYDLCPFRCVNWFIAVPPRHNIGTYNGNCQSFMPLYKLFIDLITID